MKKQLSYYVQKLEEAGIDTSKFNLELNGVLLTPNDCIKKFEENMMKVQNNDNSSYEENDEDYVYKETYRQLNQIVGDDYIITNKDLVSQFGMLCLRMQNLVTLNKKLNKEKGFDAYVRNELSYLYQFELIKKYYNSSDINFKWLFRKFFTTKVMKELVKRTASKLPYQDRTLKVQLIVESINRENKESNVYDLFIKFYQEIKNSNLWVHEFKSPEWKDAYKGLMHYCLLKYSFITEKLSFDDRNTKELNLELLYKYLDIYAETPYKFYTLYNTLNEGK